MLMMATVVSCGQEAGNMATVSGSHPDKTSVSVREKGVEVGGVRMLPSRNILRNMMASADHRTLMAAIKAAGLTETLNSTGPFTLFAPTDQAFSYFPAGTVAYLLQPGMSKELMNILTYHIVAGAYTSADLKNGMELTTLKGQKIRLSQEKGSWLVNGAKIKIADISSSNGVIYVIDAVLQPPGIHLSKQ